LVDGKRQRDDLAERRLIHHVLGDKPQRVEVLRRCFGKGPEGVGEEDQPAEALFLTSIIENRPEICPPATAELVLVRVEAPASVKVADDLDRGVATDHADH
jgi:hypothetical protein